ncbi:MAG: COQ9 family protein, partial [Pseudomonadota bacterium]
MTETDPLADDRKALLTAVLAHVPFDGWSGAALSAAVAETGVAPETARALFPRGGVDMALAFHDAGDTTLFEEMTTGDLSGLRYRDKVAHGVRRRLELVAEHREAVRRATAMFALPIYALEGSRAIWRTADTIWRALGDESRDLNWYSKRAILSGVISSTVLYWLGDESPGFARTWDFLDRRIEDVMRFEKVKARVNENPLTRAFTFSKRITSSIRRSRKSQVRAKPGLSSPSQ